MSSSSLSAFAFFGAWTTLRWLIDMIHYVRRSRTLRGFNFPPCLLDMIVVDDQLRDPDIPGLHATNHMLSIPQPASFETPTTRSIISLPETYSQSDYTQPYVAQLAHCSHIWNERDRSCTLPPGFLSAIISYELLREKVLVVVFLWFLCPYSPRGPFILSQSEDPRGLIDLLKH